MIIVGYLIGILQLLWSVSYHIAAVRPFQKIYIVVIIANSQGLLRIYRKPLAKPLCGMTLGYVRRKYLNPDGYAVKGRGGSNNLIRGQFPFNGFK